MGPRLIDTIIRGVDGGTVQQKGVVDPADAVSQYLDTPTAELNAHDRFLRESDEDYGRVLAKLNPKWRVISCRDGIQWILQRHKGREWRSRSFCATRAALLRCIREHAGDVDSLAKAIVAALPANHSKYADVLEESSDHKLLTAEGQP